MNNSVILCGRLSNDPQVIKIQGQPVIHFTLTITAQPQQNRILVFGQMIEICKKYLKKDSLVYVEGYQQDEDILARRVEFLNHPR
jgi:single-stranded DNA-binding protein